MVEFTVLDVTPVPLSDKIVAAMQRRKKEKRKGKKRAGGVGSEFVPTLAPLQEHGEAAGAASVSGKLRRKNSAGDAAEVPLDETGGPSAASVAGSELFGRAAKTSTTVGRTTKTGYSATSTVTGGPKGKYLLAEVEVAKTSDLGT